LKFYLALIMHWKKNSAKLQSMNCNELFFLNLEHFEQFQFNNRLKNI
jgi:hypothetical protein